MLQLPSFGRHRTSCSSGVGWILNDLDLALQRSGRDALIVSLSLGATRRSMAKRNEGQDRRETNETKRWAVGPLGRWATAICRSFQLRPKDDPFEETLLYLEDWTLRSLSSTSIHLYAVLAFFASIFSERLASFRMEIFAPWKASVTISEFEGHRRSPKATEGSRDKSGKSLRSKALQAPRPSGGGCNCKSLNFRRKYSYKKNVETCWNMLKHVETQKNSKNLKRKDSHSIDIYSLVFRRGSWQPCPEPCQSRTPLEK